MAVLMLKEVKLRKFVLKHLGGGIFKLHYFGVKRWFSINLVSSFSIPQRHWLKREAVASSKMADDEQFSLCWNNFNSNLSAGFHESLQRGDLVDVTLAAEGHLVKAHRLILSVCSPYFRKMFTQVPVNQHAFSKYWERSGIWSTCFVCFLKKEDAK